MGVDRKAPREATVRTSTACNEGHNRQGAVVSQTVTCKATVRDGLSFYDDQNGFIDRAGFVQDQFPEIATQTFGEQDQEIRQLDPRFDSKAHLGAPTELLQKSFELDVDLDHLYDPVPVDKLGSYPGTPHDASFQRQVKTERG